ncbi:MAG TPA: NEW3 domain-containing protein [Candidatus Thermoplasmatota archaeon]|nr:NEW3 domain-containing protein [Candidatus Thermoplasmatota archaeon]
MAGSRSVPVALLLLLSWLALPAQAQTHHCGDIQLVFRNPDLQPGQDGFIHAQGQFFAQFQAIGKDADKIKVFGFSFGPQTTDVDETVCASPAWATGAYLPNYRADSDPTDGFFIPIKTFLVPDGTYAAAVHAYDGGGTELARFWAKAIVDNCDAAPTPAQEKCDADAAQRVKHDRTAPWPIVLPGDGKALSGHKFTVEFGEALASHAVYLNGKDITAEMKEWVGRTWDGDYTPDYGPYGVGGPLPHCQAPAPVQQCESYGPAYEWLGRDLLDSDVLRIEATDLAGNLAIKDVHIGSSVAGGAVTEEEPILEYGVDHLQATAGPGKSALYHFKITNKGAGTGHPYAEAVVPKGWTYEWQPVHVVVPPGETRDQELVVTVPDKTPDGRYLVNATLTYQAKGANKLLAQPLDVIVGQASAAPSVAATSSTTASKKSPDATPAVALALVGLAALLRRR